jgi:hypothetical protein
MFEVKRGNMKAATSVQEPVRPKSLTIRARILITVWGVVGGIAALFSFLLY